MGRLIIILLLITTYAYSQSMDEVIGSTTITIIEFNTKIGAKIVLKRFDIADINKTINEVINNCKSDKREKIKKLIEIGCSSNSAKYVYRDYCYDNWFIEIEDGDEYEYFKLLGLKFYCLPKRLRKELLTFEIEIL